MPYLAVTRTVITTVEQREGEPSSATADPALLLRVGGNGLALEHVAIHRQDITILDQPLDVRVLPDRIEVVGSRGGRRGEVLATLMRDPVGEGRTPDSATPEAAASRDCQS